MSVTTEQRGPLTVHVFDALRELNVDAYVTDRFGGVSTGPYASLNLGDHVGDDPVAVAANRDLVADAAGAPLVFMRQVHGVEVRDSHLPLGEADALTTTGSGALCVLVADCVPLVVADSRRLSVVHAGWRGLAAGILPATLAQFDAPSLVRVGVGPAVSPETYQVGPEVATSFGDVPDALRPDAGDRSRLDLRAVVAHQLRRAGVSPDQVTFAPYVTDGGEVFFSDRAARPCGRFALVARRVVR